MAEGTITGFSVDNEYNKSIGITANDIKILREWLLTQPHLPIKFITDQDLVLIYHSCNCSLEQTKRSIDAHFTLRTTYDEFFKDRIYDDRIEKMFEMSLMTPLPTRTEEGYAVFYVHVLDSDPKRYNCVDSFRSMIMLLDLWQYEEGTWPGFLLVADLAGLGLGHFAKFDFTAMQHFICYLQEAMPVKLKGIYLLNAPAFINKLLMMMKPIIKNSLLDVLFVHSGGVETLKGIYPLDGLPKDAGGTHKTFQECQDDIHQKMRAGRQFFESENRKRVYENLRPAKIKHINEFEVIEGSFKQLQID